MLRSLLHYQSSTLLGLVGPISLVLSLDAWSAGNPLTEAPRTTVMNVGYMSSEDLVADAGELNLAYNPLDEVEMGQRQMNAQWLEQSSVEESDLYEGYDAVEELAENALKQYWKTLVARDHSFDIYTPVVEGRFITSNSAGADFDVRLSGDTLKLRVEYDF